jgi:hypothetical protein
MGAAVTILLLALATWLKDYVDETGRFPDRWTKILYFFVAIPLAIYLGRAVDRVRQSRRRAPEVNRESEQ